MLNILFYASLLKQKNSGIFLRCKLRYASSTEYYSLVLEEIHCANIWNLVVHRNDSQHFIAVLDPTKEEVTT